MHVLSTARFDLRVLEHGDLDAIHGIFGNAEAMEFYTRTMTRDEAGLLIARHQIRHAESGRALWAIVDRATGEVVGDCGLLDQTVEGRDIVEVAYHVLPQHWRQGIASEAAAGVRDYAFHEQGVPQVCSLIRPENIPSQGVARSIGMRPGPHVTYADLPHVIWELERD